MAIHYTECHCATFVVLQSCQNERGCCKAALKRVLKMDHLQVLRDKIGRFREEIVDIHELNQQFRRTVRNGAAAQVAHGRRQERLEAIQNELLQLASLGKGVVSTEQRKEKHRWRLHPAKQKRAA